MPSSACRVLSSRVAVVLALATAAAIVALALDPALAQTNPFGGPRPPAAPPPGPDGLFGWIIEKQNEFYRQFSGLIRAAKADGSAVWGLLGVSFLYGVFHAAGPGHGKAVISSYLVANEETWRRGIVLSFASALLQAAVAVAIVGVAAIAFSATRQAICSAERWIEIASYGFIALIGARLTWVKGRGLIRALAGSSERHDHDHGHHDHGHHHHDHAHHDHAHDDACGDHCGHSHGPTPQELAGPGGWRRGLAAIVAVGLRPCSGAIIVLVFALSQDLFWAGVAATFVMGLGTAITVAAIATMAVLAKGFAQRIAAGGSGAGTLFLRGLEVAAALVVLVFGLGLLAGYIISERLTMAC